jgi:Uma2 family endonuclease
MKPLTNGIPGSLPSGEFIPPLEPGDRLTRDEFERRYDARPHLRKAELIEGVVFMPSPVRVNRHGQPQADLITWLGVYRAGTKGVKVADNTTARLDIENEPQPDAMLYVEPIFGGQARISEDDYIEGAPEFVAEVSSSSASFDLHTKLSVYRRCGVKEYVVWRVLDRAIDWFVLAAGEFLPLEPDADGLLKSRAFPGLWLDAQSLLRGDLARVLTVLQDGIVSPEHAEFVKRLSAGK